MATTASVVLNRIELRAKLIFPTERRNVLHPQDHYLHLLKEQNVRAATGLGIYHRESS